MFQKVFDDAGVSPGEEAVEIADLGIEAVVSFRHQHHTAVSTGGDGTDTVSQFGDFSGTVYKFGVTNAEFAECGTGFFIDTDTGDDQRAEKVTFTAFVDTAVGGDDLRNRRTNCRKY